MKKILLLSTGVLFPFFMNAQKIYVYSGKNQTTYAYKTTPGATQPDLKNDNGYYYEIGYEHDISKSWVYMGGVALNQFNNIGGDANNYYSWKTRYVGLNNNIAYAFFNKNAYRALITGGVGISKLVSGAQQINNSFYDLKNQDNFNGLFVQPSLGLEVRYNLADLAEFSLKYGYSKAWNVSDVHDGEKLSFNTSQLALGVHIPLKDSRKSYADKKQQQEAKIAEENASKEAALKQDAAKAEAVNSQLAASETSKTEGASNTQGADNTSYVAANRSNIAKELINGSYVTAYFDVAKTQPTNVSTEGIDFVLTYLRSNPNSKVKIYGNSDVTGSTKYNDELALARANAVKHILKASGIQESRMTVVSKGEDNSVDSESEGAKRLVRRVTFQVD